MNTQNKELITRFKLPSYIIGKSFADASRAISSKFEGRNDMVSNNTKNELLKRLSEAQEYLKSQEQVEQSNQMALGGQLQNNQLENAIGEAAYMGADAIAPGAGQVLKLGDQLGQSIGDDIGGKTGESWGGALGATGNLKGMGSVLKTGNINDIPLVGIFGGQTTKQKEKLKQANELATNTNRQLSDNYFAMGGEIDPPTKGDTWQTKNIVKYQPGVTSGKNGDSGFYLYSKDNSDPTFDYKTDREFVKNSSMDVVQKTAQWQNYMRSKNKVVNPDINLNLPNPIVNELAYSGKMNQMAGGGYYDKNRPYFTTNPGTVVPTNQETVSSNKLVPFPRPQLQGLSFIPPINKEERVAYQRSKGLSAKDATGTLGPKTKAWIASDVMNSIPETPPSVNTEDPIITPTQTQAGFEAYYNNTKQNQITAKPSFGQQVWDTTKKVGKVAIDHSDLLRYAPAVTNALQLAKLKKPTGVRLDKLGNRYTPDYLDLAQQQNIVNQELNNTNSAIQQSGASQGQSRAAILGAQLNKTRALSGAYANAQVQNAQQNATAQQFNLGVDQTNLSQSNLQQDINDRNIGNYDTQKSKLQSQIGTDLGNIGKEELFKKYPERMGLMYDAKGNPVSGAKQDEKGIWRDKEGNELFPSNKKEKGGYLNSDVLSHINNMYMKRNNK